MISVILDEEMVEEFEDKVIRFDTDWFVPGTPIYFNGCWRYASSYSHTFILADYDDEFTEWLKEHRPEVFL